VVASFRGYEPGNVDKQMEVGDSERIIAAFLAIDEAEYGPRNHPSGRRTTGRRR
jgi:hypothetical protein